MARRSGTLAVLFAFASSVATYAACPTAAPGAMIMVPLQCPYAYNSCINGPVTLVLQPSPSGGFPPAPYDPGYSIQPCDVVEWSFGDGSTQIVTGSDRVTHNYPNPGNYTIRASVTNSLGSATMQRDTVLAISPSRLSYVTSTIAVSFPNSVTSPCKSCVEAREGSTTTVTVKRTLDLSRTVSADAVVRIDRTEVRAPLKFAPGETEKSFDITVPDDHVYSGPRFSSLLFVNTTGGTLTLENVSYQPQLVIIDASPAPILSIEPTFTVTEGDSGLKLISIPVHLSAPMGVDTYANTFFTPGSATWSDFVPQYGPYFHAGETVTDVTASIRGNTKPEGDKTFHVRLASAGLNENAEFGNSVCVVTIVNDDAALYPAATSTTPSQPLTLTLDLGSPFTAPTTVSFTSSDPNVIPNPARIVIPPGTTRTDVTLSARAAGQTQISAIVPGRTTQAAVVTVGLTAIPALGNAALWALSAALLILAFVRLAD